MNPVLDKVWYKIRLFSSNIVASLRPAIAVAVLIESSYLDKPPHHVKVGFIEGSWFVHMCVFVCACMCMCVRLHPFTVNASSVWISWNATEQINDVVAEYFSFLCQVPLSLL